MAQAAAVATRLHVAGPPEKWPTPQRKAGWEWQQRCLRCDEPLSVTGIWWRLGTAVYELDDGTLTTEPPPGSHGPSAAPCAPEEG